MLRTSLLVFMLGALCVLAKEDLFPDKYDYVDVDAILANQKLREQYYNCFMDTGPCVTPDAKFFKGFLPETIATQCGRCTKRQHEMFDSIAAWYADNDIDKWNALVAKLLEEAKKMKVTAKPA